MRPKTTPETQAPADLAPRPLHKALTLTGRVGRVHPLALTPVWFALALLACLPWARTSQAILAAALALGFTLADGIGLALLPRQGRSFGPVTPFLLALATGRALLIGGVGLLWPTVAGLGLTLGLNLAGSAIVLYATWIEPFRLQVTRAALHSSKLRGERPLRLLHVTDLHLERITLRERRLLRMAGELNPDAVILTGDYLNLSTIYDPQAQADARRVLDGLCETAPGAVYAIAGSPSVDRADVVPGVFAGLPIEWLVDELRTVDLNGHRMHIGGLRCNRDRHRDAPRLRRLLQDREPGFTLLLYHSPDLMPEATALGVDLYLCGHTHGGQIRLPFFGAVVTSSHFWKRYEMGRYEEDGTTLYVSRGLGLEGLGAPRARFLAPPEITLWTLSRSP